MWMAIGAALSLALLTAIVMGAFWSRNTIRRLKDEKEEIRLSLERELTEIRSRHVQLEEGLRESQKRAAQLETQLALTEGTLKQERDYIKNLTVQMEHNFQSLAGKALQSHSQQFLHLAKEVLNNEAQGSKVDLEKRQLAIETMVTPLKETLERYQKEVFTMEKERHRSYSQIELELKRVIETNENLQNQTRALKDALRRPHVRGRWGEIQLKNCVEIAGLSEFADVTFQHVTESSEGKRLIPDLTVKMPGGRVVIVDAKTPIDAFLGALEAPTDEERATEMARHGKHVKEHILKLSQKAYAAEWGPSADFTVMFLPNESFLYAALESQPDLVDFALKRKILIATPPTFVGLLKVIHFGWSEEKLAQNAREISEAAKELHKRLSDFVDSFLTIGKHIEKAHSEYEAGMKRLNQRVLVQARRIEDLGASSQKRLPEA